jgi:hypothetical protein
MKMLQCIRGRAGTHRCKHLAPGPRPTTALNPESHIADSEAHHTPSTNSAPQRSTTVMSMRRGRLLRTQMSARNFSGLLVRPSSPPRSVGARKDGVHFTEQPHILSLRCPEPYLTSQSLSSSRESSGMLFSRRAKCDHACQYW